jgi:hypothetical protein
LFFGDKELHRLTTSCLGARDTQPSSSQSEGNHTQRQRQGSAIGAMEDSTRPGVPRDTRDGQLAHAV